VCADHAFHAVGDQFAGAEGIFHAVVAHGDAVTDADGVEFHRRAAGTEHAAFDRLGDHLQVGVSGDDFIEGIDYADQRPVDLPLGHAHGLHQGAVRRAFDACLNVI